jgi:haloalkane dehalogenase
MWTMGMGASVYPDAFHFSCILPATREDEMATSRLPRRFVNVAGVQTAYLDAGEGSDAVVALHGVPTSSELFEPLLPALAGFRLIAPDLVAQGQTAAPPGLLGWSTYAHHLAAFLDAVAPHRFDLVVHDLGGLLGLDWAGRHPDRVRRLVVLSTTVTATFRWMALWTAMWGFELVAGAAGVRRAIVGLGKRPGAIPPDLAVRWSQPWTRGRVLRSLDLLAPWRLGAVAERLGSVRSPALLVWGERDEVFPPEYAAPIVAALPGAELRIVPGAGHWSMLDAPEVVGGHVASFLRDEAPSAVSALTPTRR